MALVDSSENAILDLSKKIGAHDPDSRLSVPNLISKITEKAFPPDERMMMTLQTAPPSEISKNENIRSNRRIETGIPDSQTFIKSATGILQICNSPVSPGDVHSFVESAYSASALVPRDISSVWMRTLPHRKRPLAMLGSMNDCGDFDIKRANFSDEICSLVSARNEDQESSTSNSRSPEMFSPSNTPGKCEPATHCCIQTTGDRPRSSSAIKSSSRSRGGQLKDDAYWERRRKNNEAAKRSRDTRKQKEEETAHKARSLAQENISLRAEINILRTQLCNMQSMLFYRTNSHSLM